MQLMPGFFWMPQFYKQVMSETSNQTQLISYSRTSKHQFICGMQVGFSHYSDGTFNGCRTHKSFQHTMMPGFFMIPQFCKQVMSETSNQTQLISYSRTSKHQFIFGMQVGYSHCNYRTFDFV